MLATVEKAGERKQQPTRSSRTAAATEVDFNRERADSKTSSPQANASTPTPQANKITSISETNKSLSSLQTSARSSSPSSTWPPTKCTPLCNERCSYAGKHHELIMAMMKCSNGSEIDKTDFKKSLDKFGKTKWLRNGCIPDRDEKLRLPLVHWACMLGKYKALEYLVSEKGFELTTKVGKNQHGPLHSMVQHLHSCLNPKSSKEYVSNMFGNIVDVFLKYTVDVLCEKDPSTGDTILHFLAKRCCSDIFSRMYLKTLLVKIKENAKVSQEKLYEILSAVNKRGDTFLHVIVPDEESVPTLNYFFGNFGLNSEKISKAKNNFGKTPRQIAVEKRSFQMLKALGAPDVVINSLQKAVAGGKSNTGTPKRVRFIDEKDAKKSPSKTSPATKSSSEDNAKLEDKESSTHSSTIVDLTTQEKSTVGASSGEQQGWENVHVSSDQLQTEVLKLCSCDSPNDKKDQATDSSVPTKRKIEPFPQRNPGNEKGNKTSPGKSVGAEEKAGEVVEVIDIPEDMPEAPTNSSDSNVFLSLSNTVNSLKKGDSSSTGRKRPALTTLKSKAPRRKRGRGSWSDSESDVEDEEDLNLDDDSDDDVESEEEDLEGEEMDEEEVDNEEAESVSSTGKEAAEIRNEDDIELETAPKHTPFCSQDCSSQHHKLLLSLLKCSNYNYGMEHNNTFMKQVNDYINQHGKFSDVRANADLPDPMPPFQYPLVHWVCVLGKHKVLERLTELKEFDFAVQSERTGETGLHRMLLSLDRAMVALKKSSVKTILDVFSKTLRTLTENAPIVLTLNNKEGDTPFHCMAKVILDCTGELERMNTYEGYFEHLMKELARLRVSGKLTSDAARELLLKKNNSQETFLHILACRHGVGQRVIKRVLKNIEPEIMDLLKEIKDANDKTASDLAEDLCSYEMAAILRPHDQEAGPPDWVDDVVEDLPQTPDSGTPHETLDIQSPPPTLFPSSPVFPDADAARVRLFAVKKEPGVDDTEFDETTLEDPAEVNWSSSSLQTTEDAVKTEPNIDDSEDPPEINSSPNTSQTTEDVQLPPVYTSPNHANPSPTRPTKEDVNAIASAGGSSESSVAAATVNDNMSSNMPSLPAVPGTSRKSAGTPTTSQSPNGSASHSSSVLADHSKNSGKKPSIISKISKFNLPQTDKLLNTLHAKFQEQLAQSEKGLGEKEDTLVRVLHRMTEAQERRQKLQQELDENLNEMLAIKQEEGLLRSEIAVQKRDCEKFKAELEKYAGIREQEK